jgi:hypothetical protein
MSAFAIMPSPRTPPAENRVLDCGGLPLIWLVTWVFWGQTKLYLNARKSILASLPSLALL